jgi:hypothetical protein
MKGVGLMNWKTKTFISVCVLLLISIGLNWYLLSHPRIKTVEVEKIKYKDRIIYQNVSTKTEVTGPLAGEIEVKKPKIIVNDKDATDKVVIVTPTETKVLEPEPLIQENEQPSEIQTEKENIINQAEKENIINQAEKENIINQEEKENIINQEETFPQIGGSFPEEPKKNDLNKNDDEKTVVETTTTIRVEVPEPPEYKWTISTSLSTRDVEIFAGRNFVNQHFVIGGGVRYEFETKEVIPFLRIQFQFSF